MLIGDKKGVPQQLLFWWQSFSMGGDTIECGCMGGEGEREGRGRGANRWEGDDLSSRESAKVPVRPAAVPS